MAEALRENSTLQQLELVSNDIGNEGAQAIAEALRENSTLLYLEMFPGCQIRGTSTTDSWLRSQL